jgi:GNAT superfamily N-acetyltransferase
MEITYLADHPELVPVLARWLLDEWGHIVADPTIDAAEARYRDWCRKDALPLSLVALEEGKPAGMASVRFHEMKQYPQFEHWLATVYVVPERRGNGIGSALVAAAEKTARKFGVGALYLYTPDKERFYTRLGWSLVEMTPHKGKTVYVMRKNLTP